MVFSCCCYLGELFEGYDHDDDDYEVSNLSVWVAYFLMFLGWLLFVRGLLDFMRIRRAVQTQVVVASS